MGTVTLLRWSKVFVAKDKGNGDKMKEKVCTYIESLHMIEKDDRIVIGLSGGADSVALLLVLQELRQKMALEIYAVHINHGIRREATEDANYARSLCASFQIPFFLYEADIPVMAKEQGKTEEEMGRIYRYQCFGEVMKQQNANKLAVAHHMDDQAETMLFHLIRGSRISGLSGIKPVAPFWMEEEIGKESMENWSVIRPLLCLRKKEIQDWLQCENVEWKEDCTNADDAYSRNRIRNQVLPVLESINSQAVSHMAELAEEMRGYQLFLQKMVDSYMDTEVEETGTGTLSVNRATLLQQNDLLKSAVLYEMMVRVCGRKKDISSVHVNSLKELLMNQSGRRFSLPYEMEAEISYEMLTIGKGLQMGRNVSYEPVQICREKLHNKHGEEVRLALGHDRCLRVRLHYKTQYSNEEWKRLVKQAVNSKNDYTKFFGYDTIENTLCVRLAEQNDYFVMNEAGDRKKLSRYFKDEKIPISQRKNILVLAAGEQVLWILGRRRSESFKVSEGNETILQLIYEGE